MLTPLTINSGGENHGLRRKGDERRLKSTSTPPVEDTDDCRREDGSLTGTPSNESETGSSCFLTTLVGTLVGS